MLERHARRGFAMLSASCQLHVIASRTASMFGVTGAVVENLADTISGSFRPWPVQVQTIVASFGIKSRRFSRANLNNPAMGAALAGSTKIPSVCASHD